MRKFLIYNDKLVEEVGYVQNEKVVFLRYVRTEDMPKCECGRPIEKDIDIVENCRNYRESCRPIETIAPLSTKD
jgi:hypothetical protein